MESGDAVGGALLPYHSLPIANPTGREEPCTWIPFYYLSKRKKGFPPEAQTMKNSPNSANEKPLYLNSHFIPVDFLFITASPSAPLLHK